MNPTPAPFRDWNRIYLWTVALCLFLALLGLYADVVGHMVIPRDRFWSPTHTRVYGPLLAAVGVTVVRLFGLQLKPGPPTAPGIRVPLLAHPLPPPLLLMAAGLFLIPAGGLFDQWWHAALGQRETLYSPPHMLAIAGAALAAVGLLVSAANDRSRSGALLLALLFGGLLVLAGLLLGPLDSVGRAEDYSWLVEHRAPGGDPGLNRFETSIALGLHRQNGLLLPFLGSALLLPPLLLARRLSDHRWAATTAALFYTAVRGGLFLLYTPAPGRWPFLPPPLPILAPALAVDLLARTAARPPLAGAAAGGVFATALGISAGAWSLPGLAGAVAAGALSEWAAVWVAPLLEGLTPKRAVALLLLGLAAPVALGLFDLKARGVL